MDASVFFHVTAAETVSKFRCKFWQRMQNALAYAAWIGQTQAEGLWNDVEELAEGAVCSEHSQAGAATAQWKNPRLAVVADW
jgi:hypothetical protein